MRSVGAGLLVLAVVAGGCKSNPLDSAPATIDPARAATSPQPATPPAGQVLPLAGTPDAAVLAGGSLVLLNPGADAASAATLTVLDPALEPGRAARRVALPGPAAAITTDGRDTVYAATRGAVVTVNLTGGAPTTTRIDGAPDAEFTAIARRADGRLVLGSADGVAYTLGSDLHVTGQAPIFARVDAIAAPGDTAVVLDRGQTSVTALNPDGSRAQALRAGLGATSMAADPAGRVLVTDTRGGQLLVFGVDPLIARQAYPVGESPYGIAGSTRLAWVSLTASNIVVGYDLATGIPVEKVRYPTVQQPNTLAYDEKADTLYVVSGVGAGVQVIRDAARPR